MDKKIFLRIFIGGITAGFISEGIMGAIFSSSPVQAILYNPSIQSKLFMEITPLRNLLISVTGMIILSIIHSWLYYRIILPLNFKSWIRSGLFWGSIIWAMYWVFQEWFIYHTLLNEPLMLCLLELTILLAGSFIEGLIIAFIFKKKGLRVVIPQTNK